MRIIQAETCVHDTGVLALGTCVAKVRPADMAKVYQTRAGEIWTKRGGFTGMLSGVTASKYDAQNLTRILQEYSVTPARSSATKSIAAGIERQLRMDEPHDGPKTFVVAAKQQPTAVEPFTQCLFRAYPNPDCGSEGRNDCEVWEAGRATTAAPTFFDPFEMGSERYESVVP